MTTPPFNSQLSSLLDFVSCITRSSFYSFRDHEDAIQKLESYCFMVGVNEHFESQIGVVVSKLASSLARINTRLLQFRLSFPYKMFLLLKTSNLIWALPNNESLYKYCISFTSSTYFLKTFSSSHKFNILTLETFLNICPTNCKLLAFVLAYVIF